MKLLLLTFCTLLIASAFLVVQSLNPVYSVLYLILAFFNASALTLLSGHDYMAALFIVLYVGALCTFFLFIIMILDFKVENASKTRIKIIPIYALVAFLFVFIVKGLLTFSESGSELALCYPLTSAIMNETTQIYTIGATMYTFYSFYLFLGSLILLAAMIGSIALTLNKSHYSKTQGVYEQNVKDFRFAITKNS
jgi:NADH-quinone oxidoreductase subunit J